MVQNRFNPIVFTIENSANGVKPALFVCAAASKPVCYLFIGKHLSYHVITTADIENSFVFIAFILWKSQNLRKLSCK